MMSRRSLYWLAAVLAIVAGAAHAQSTSSQKEATMPVASASLQNLMRAPLVLRGTLGAEQIQVHLRPKSDEDGIEGSYFVFGQGVQILLAGEVDHDDLIMEESLNGQDVSGQWEGVFKGGFVSGTWSSPDGAQSKPFVLSLGALTHK